MDDPSWMAKVKKDCLKTMAVLSHLEIARGQITSSHVLRLGCHSLSNKIYTKGNNPGFSISWGLLFAGAEAIRARVVGFESIRRCSFFSRDRE
jgi:hypothetical protein